MEMSVRYGYPTTLTAIDKDGNWAQVQGDMPELAVSRPLDQAALAKAAERPTRSLTFRWSWRRD